MKKVLGISLTLVLLLTGCGKYGEKEIVKDLAKDLKNLKAYYLEGEMEIINNEDIYEYDVKVSYMKDDLYRVSLRNKSNNHEQIILKNADGVYVLTPSLNKSFKFESEWPYNNSQVYLLQSLIDDIDSDDSREFEEVEDGYLFTTAVNYPNNRSLVNQEILIDKNLNFKNVNVKNEKGDTEITMVFSTIDKNPTFADDYFEVSKNLETAVIDETVNPVVDIEDVIFPMYLPENTSLSAQDTITKDIGERIILTFSGDKPFVLVEETVTKSDELEIIPTLGDPALLIDTIGSLSTNSVSWISNGVEYYIASEILSEEEMVTIAKSIGSIPVMK